MKFFKVTTADNKSLGLRNNPTILTFLLGKWVSSPTIEKSASDSGGIWLCASLSNAKKLVKYMMEHYAVKCKIYKALIGRVLYKNNYRLKTDRVKLIEEIKR